MTRVANKSGELLKGAKKTYKVIQEYMLKDREKENGYGKYFKEK